MSDGGTSAATTAAANPAVITTGNISTTGYTGISFTYGYRISSTSYTGTIKCEYSTDGGSNWTVYNNAASGSGLFTVTSGTWTLLAAQALPAAADNISNFRMRWTFTRTNTSGNFRIDDIKLTGTAMACSTPTDISLLSATPASGQITLNWTNGSCFDEMLVLASTNSSLTSTPTGNGSLYTANAAYGTSGTNANLNTGEYAVYKGSSNSIAVTGLTNGTLYAFKIFTRKGTAWSSGVAITATPFQSKYFWNGGNTSANPANGGTGAFGTANAWRSPTANGAATTFGSGLDAVFAGTAGTVTIDGNYTSTNFDFQTSGYTLATSDNTTRTLTGPISLGSTSQLTFGINASNTTANGGTLNLNGISGSGTSAVVLTANAPALSANRINLAVANGSVTVPTTINGTGSGNAGYVATATGITISGNISNNSSNNTCIGATSGNDITVNSIISGSGNLQFAAGNSGGAGTVTLLKQNTYTGATQFNLALSGTVKLGINNAIPTGSNVVMSYSSSNGGSLDLNGFDQTIGSITSNILGGTSSITNSAVGTGTNVLTISGSSAPAALDLAIKDGSTKKIALVRSGSGTTVLSGANTYTGTTTVSSGRLIINGSSVAASSAAVNGGYFGGSGTFNGSVTVAAGATISAAGTNTGNSTGLLTTGALTLNSDAIYVWDINNWSGTAGTSNGWDKISSNAAITINATSSNPIVIDITGLTATNNVGVVPNYSISANKTFVIASGTSISGFAVNKFSILTTNFAASNPLSGGIWSIQQTGNNIELVFTAPAPTPAISISSSLNSFSTFYTSPSVAQTYTVSGSNLTGDINISVGTGYEIKTGAGSYGPSITLTPTAGSISSTTISVRLTGTTLPLTATGTITHTSTGASPQTIALTGEVLPRVVINEIHYNPNDAAGYTDANYEFLEFYNTESFAVSLTNYTTFGVTHTFGSVSIPANGYLVLAAYAPTYPGSIQWAGGSLNNSGEPIALRSPAGNTIDSVNYGISSPWPTSANGNGPSLELNDPFQDNLLAANWHANVCNDNGTPGAANSIPSGVSTLYSVGSGAASTAAIWACSPTGTGRTIATYGGFSTALNLVIQNGHTVDVSASINMKNLTVQSGGVIRRNSPLAANMAYLNIYGNSVVINGTLGIANTFDAIGFNIEASSVTLSGNGAAYIGRIRKSAVSDSISSLTIDKDISLWFPGTAIYNNTNATSVFNVIVNAGRTVTFNNGADLSIDGISGNNISQELYGTFDVYGTVTGLDTLYARSQNLAGTNGLIIRNGGSVRANAVIDSAVAGNDFKLDIRSGGTLTVLDRFNAVRGTLNIPSGASVIFVSTNDHQCAILDNFSTGFSGSITGEVKAQRYISGTGTNQHYICSPLDQPAFSSMGVSLTGVDNVAVTPALNCSEDSLYYTSNYGNIFEWNEGLVSQGQCFMKGWVVRSAGNMTNARGYSAYLPGSDSVVLSGVPNQASSYSLANLGNHNWTSVTAEGRPFVSGWHLVGNPYLSNINLDNTYAGFQAQIQIYNASGPYSGTFSAKMQGVDAVIAPFQAFMIRNPSPGTMATFTVNRSEQVASGSAVFGKTESNARALKLLVHGNGFADATQIEFNDYATDNFDDSYDANKFRSNRGQPTLYTKIGGEWASINSLPTPTNELQLPVYFESGSSGSFAFSFEGLTEFSEFEIAIEDKKLSSFTKLNDGMSYSFTSIPSDDPARFVLHINYKKTEAISSVASDEVKIYNKGNNVVVVTEGAIQDVSVSIFNFIGQLLYSGTIRGKQADLPISEQEHGIIVKVTTPSGNTTVKLIR
ncbi:MAG: lamin tail domain-containing protein [Chitinophagales bacterium]